MDHRFVAEQDEYYTACFIIFKERFEPSHSGFWKENDIQGKNMCIYRSSSYVRRKSKQLEVCAGIKTRPLSNISLSLNCSLFSLSTMPNLNCTDCQRNFPNPPPIENPSVSETCRCGKCAALSKHDLHSEGWHQTMVSAMYAPVATLNLH